MNIRRVSRVCTGLLLAAGLSGCGTLSSLDSASRPVDTYELSPLTGAATAGSAGGPILFVDEPSSSAAIQSDRIVMKPTARQITYLSDARLIEPVPAHFRRLLKQSLFNTGQYRFVSSNSSGPLADYIILTDIEAFQAELTGSDAGPVRVVVRATMTLLRDSDLGVVSTRRFEKVVVLSSDDGSGIVSAIDAASVSLMRDAANWIAGRLGRRQV